MYTLLRKLPKKHYKKFSDVIDPLKQAILVSSNKKIFDIVPVFDNFTYIGVVFVYDDGKTDVIDCPKTTIGPIMWYFNIDKPYFTGNIDHNTKYSIMRNLE